MNHCRHPRLTLLALLLTGSATLASASDRDELSVRADPPYVSPNSDGLQDEAFFYPVVQARSAITRWRMDIMRARGGRVARLSGAGIPGLIKWDVMGKKGLVTDGEYRVRLETWSASSHLRAEGSFFVDTVAPVGTLTLSTPTIDSSILHGKPITLFSSTIDASPIERWQYQILDETGRTVQLFWSTGPAREVTWDGSDRDAGGIVPQGRYKIAFQAWDAAGNLGQPTFRDVEVRLRAREALEREFSNIQVLQSSSSLVVQLPSEKVFGFRKGRVVLAAAGPAYLREVALVANSYPNANIILDGFSKAYPAIDKDQSLSSLYAWQVYSYLVKTGNVKASRITVRGRGWPVVDPSSDRPALRNGVEVVFDGAGPW